MAQPDPIPDEIDGEEDHLTDCGICLSEIENPKALPCLHSFCLKCLKKVKHPPGVLTCPLCQEDIPLPPGGVDGFRDNFFINQLKERRAIKKIGDVKMPCISCAATDRVVSARCVDCNGFLCQQCVDLHKNIAPLKVHTVFTIKELRSGKVNLSKLVKDECCQKHKDQLLRFFCKTCGIPICHVCTVIEHSRPEHDYVTLESATEGQLAEIRELVANCKDIAQKVETAKIQAQNVKTNLKSALDRANRSLSSAKTKAQEHFLRTLEENYKSSAEQLDKINMERSKQIDTNETGLTNLQAKLNNAMEIANQVMTSDSKHDVASNYTTLTNTLKQFKEDQVVLCEDDLSVVEFRRNRFVQMAKALGTIRETKAKGKWVLQKESGKDGEGKVSSGFGVAVAPNGDIAVADYSAAQVKVFNSDQDFKLSLDTKQGLQQGKTSHPWDVAVNSNGQYYVSDSTAYVKVYSPEGKYLKQFPVKSPDGTSSDADGSALRGLAIDNEGHLLVGNNKKYISKHKQDGTLVSTMKVGIHPYFIAVTSQGRIIVSPHSSNTGVQVLDHTGILLHTINAPKDAKSWNPTGVCCSDDDVIYISSYDSGDKGGIYSFTEEGKYLGCVTTDVTWTRGLAFTCDGNDKLVVAQATGHPAKIFSLT